MDLDKQIQLLIDDAPQDGVTPRVVAAIAPVLKRIAGKLRYHSYYILQNLDQEWILTTLSNRANNEVEKSVIYAFPTIQDITNVSAAKLDPQIIAVPVLVTNILFQLITLEMVDSIIFFETPGASNAGIEVRREDIQNLIQVQLKQIETATTTSLSQLPSDIA